MNVLRLIPWRGYKKPAASVPWHRSLNLRIGAIIAFGIMITSTISAGAMVFRALERRQAERQVELQSSANVLASTLSQALERGDRTQIMRVLRSIGYAEHIASGEVWNMSGERLGVMGQQSMLIGNTDSKHSANPISVRTDVRNGGKVVGFVRLVSSEMVILPLRQDIIAAALFGLMAALLGGTLAILQQRRMFKPLERLTAEMKRAHIRSHLPDRLQFDSRDEIGVLVRSYNGMIEQIHEREKALERHRMHLSDLVEERTREAHLARLEAESANAAKSHFLAAMSHEIRTPMNGMLVMAELLARSNLPSVEKGYARIVHRSGAALLELLNDILDLSKIEAGQIEIESIEVDPDQCVSDTLALFWTKAKEKGVALTSHVDPAVPLSFVGDPTRLRQCLSNLLGNAVKFTASGRIDVAVCWQDDPSPDTDGILSIDVRDTGPGIQADRLEQIFEAFVQEDQSTTRLHGGTGLGLSITRQLVDAMNGTIHVDSEEGVGSCFSIHLPCKSLVMPEPSPDRHPVQVAVDCHDIHETEALSKALRARGIDVVTSGEEDSAACRITSQPLVTDRPVDDSIPEIICWPMDASPPIRPLKQGRFVDSLRMPHDRRALDALIEAIRTGQFRGIESLDDDAQADEQTEIRFENARILIADDNEVNRQVIAASLDLFGIEPVMVSDGAQALEAFENAPFDLILLDGDMPVMDGYEAARRMRAQKLNAKLVLFSATIPDNDSVSEAGFLDSLPKPFHVHQLGALLSRYLKSSPTSSNSAIEHCKPELSPTEDPEEQVLCPSTLENLRRLDKRRPGALAKIFRSFMDSAPEATDKVVSTWRDGDVEGVQKAAHFLKSSASSIGALQIVELSRQIESRASTALAKEQPYPFDEETMSALDSAIKAALERLENESG